MGNITQKLLSQNFVLQERDNYSLKIFTNYLDRNTGKTKTSNIRTEINGLHNIQKYCKTGSLNGDSSYQKAVKFLQKKRKFVNNEILKPIDFTEVFVSTFQLSINEVNRNSQCWLRNPDPQLVSRKLHIPAL